MIRRINSIQTQRQNFGSVSQLRQVIVNGTSVSDEKEKEASLNQVINILMKLDKDEPNAPELQKINQEIRDTFKSQIPDYRFSNDYNKASRSTGYWVQMNLKIEKLKDASSKFLGLLTGNPVKEIDEAKVALTKAKRFNPCSSQTALKNYNETKKRILNLKRAPSFIIFKEKIAGKIRPTKIIFW